MKERGVNGNEGVDAEKARRLRLGGFLRDLIRQEGKMEAAELLGVNYKTLHQAEETREITGRMGDALELLLRRADDAEVEHLRETVGVLEERVAELEGGAAAHRTVDIEGAGEGDDVEDGAEGGAQAQDDGDDEGAGRSETRPAPPAEEPRPGKQWRPRRSDPEVVTEQPAVDDEEVYGKAWPLVKEWRRLRDGHPHQGRTLSWLTTHERLLVLELAMLEEHGLTLPPETQALRGFGRRGQTSWRRKALSDTRTSLKRRRLLRWVRRILTFGLWRK